MTVCTACGAENVDGTRFCVKCGAGIAPAPEPGAWNAPSGNLYDQQTPSGGFNNPGSYTPPPASYPAAYSTPQGMMGGQMNYAQWIDRVAAALIDGLLAAVVMIGLYIVFGVIGGGLGAIGSGLGENVGGGLFEGLGSAVCCFGTLLAAIAVFGVGIYNKVYLVNKRGYSIGQGIMKLKVVTADGNLVPIGTLVLRLLVQMGLSFIPFIGVFLVLLNVLWPLWDEKRQTLHDKAAGTFVIKTT